MVGTRGEKKGVARIREVKYAGMIRGQVIILNRTVRVGFKENRFKDLTKIKELAIWVIRKSFAGPGNSQNEGLVDKE